MRVVARPICIGKSVASIARYAHGTGVGGATAQVNVNETERLPSLTFVDNDTPFDPHQYARAQHNVAFGRVSDKRAETVYGQEKLDTMEYRREGKHNVLIVRKYI